MNLEDYRADDTLRDIAKGRYSVSRIKKLFHTMLEESNKAVERNVFEYTSLVFLQALHYDFGFQLEDLNRLMKSFDSMVEAFDSNSYSIDDMKQALYQDAGFKLTISWNELE